MSLDGQTETSYMIGDEIRVPGKREIVNEELRALDYPKYLRSIKDTIGMFTISPQDSYHTFVYMNSTMDFCLCRVNIERNGRVSQN